MLVVYWFLLLMYITLCVLYVYAKPKPVHVKPWPLLPVAPKTTQSVFACEDDLDCSPNHVCLGHTCLPKLLRGSDCTLPYGQWVAHIKKGITFAICSCVNDELFTQKLFGGDCTVNVGCGVHGTFNLQENKCECDAGYVADGLTCRKLPVLEYITECGPDELNVSEMTQFHPDYNVYPAKCVKKPCSFDALSGRPLQHAFHDAEFGCVCDPKYGLFGVVLKGANKKYLNMTRGYDACASIFVKDPQDPIDVKLVTYFYLGEREPVSFILFQNVKDVISVFDSENFMIRQQDWRFDYAQYLFRTQPQFHARIQKLYKDPIFHIETVHNVNVNDFTLRDCSSLMNDYQNDKVSAYQVLYANPVCKVIADPIFHDRVILNPNHLTLNDFNELPRFNAFVLHYDKSLERWSLNLDYSLDTDLYRSIDTNVPKY